MDVFRTSTWLGPGVFSLALALTFMTAFSPSVSAQTASTAGSVTGTVTSSDGAPLGGASVTLQGAAAQTTTSDAKGHFTFQKVTPGAYAVVVTKPGFATTQQEDVYVVAGNAVTVNAVLAQSSFSSLRTIGRVSTNVPGRVTINTTPASAAVISNQTFADQGQVQVTKVLNETPGIITGPIGYSGTSQGSPQITQIRGSLPYETESLIDGHPVSVGADGWYSPIYLNPALLQNVEIVKGPGAMGSEINYAINGSVNYRTLEPTRTPVQTFELGVDGFGGVNTAFQATGSTFNHRLDYAFAAATNGTPSAVHNYQIAGSQVPLLYGAPPWTVNGQVVAQTPFGVAASNTPQFYSTPGAARYAQPLYVCCASTDDGYNSKAELAKLRFNFSQTTALTLSYLGGQAFYNNPLQDSSLSPVGNTGQSFSTFSPPKGYTGSVPAGTPIPYDTLAWVPSYDSAQQNLVQAEFRTTLGESNSVLARYYTGYSSQNNYEYFGSGSTYQWTGTAWGGLLMCPPGTGVVKGGCGAPGSPTVAPSVTYFNGTPVTFGNTIVPSATLTQDHLRGYSAEFDHMSGKNTYTVSFDRSHHDSLQYANQPLSGIVGYQLFPGSGQQFTTISVRGQFALSPTVTASLGDYFVQYASHYTDNGGASWQDAVHNANEPRLGLAWRPSTDLALRFSAGGSIAPPYITILSSPGGNPVPNATGGATAYTLNQNNGAVSPETAFGYDLGFDKRLAGAMSLSGDVYLTSLHNMFLPVTYQNGTYTPPSGADKGNTEPLYLTQTANLGQARYEGIELALQRTPLVGFGFRLQGSLERAFTYNLPPGFYNTAAGPYTANLGVIPNVNFFGSAGFYSGIQGGRVPYSMGYGEANYRTRAGTYYNLGVTYYGPNNAFNVPAFTVVSAAARFRLAKDTSLTVSGDNITGSYDQPFGYYMGGVPVPLANGAYAGATKGYLGITRGSNYGPAVIRVTLRTRLGQSL